MEIPVYKKYAIPIPHPVPVPIPQQIKVPIPQPYQVEVPVPHPVPIEVVKHVEIPVEKPEPYVVEKKVRSNEWNFSILKFLTLLDIKKKEKEKIIKRQFEKKSRESFPSNFWFIVFNEKNKRKTTYKR